MKTKKKWTIRTIIIFTMTLFLSTMLFLNSNIVKAWNSITDPPVNHLTQGTEIINEMYGGKASFRIQDIDLTTQYATFEEIYVYFYSSVLTQEIFLYFSNGGGPVSTLQFTTGTLYTEMKYVIEVPATTTNVMIRYVTTETSYTYAFSAEKDAFINNSYMKNNDYIESLSYTEIYAEGYADGYAEGNNNYSEGYNDATEDVAEDIFNNGIDNYIDPSTDTFYVREDSFDYIMGYNEGYDYAERTIPEDIFDFGIDSYIDPDTATNFVMSDSHDFIQGVAMDEAYAYSQGYLDGSQDSFLAKLDTWIVPAIIIVLIGGTLLTIGARKLVGRRD